MSNDRLDFEMRSLAGRARLRPRPRGFSLIEALVVVAILLALGGAYVSLARPQVSSRLQTVADMLAADLERAQEVAVARGAPHRATFEGPERRFVLRHVGAQAVFDELPRYARTRTQEADDRATYDLDERSPYGRYVRFAAFEPADLYVDEEFPLEFADDGSLADGRTATIWLSVLDEGTVRYLPLKVYAVTGVVSVGTTRNDLPSGVAVVGFGG